jgi:transposase
MMSCYSLDLRQKVVSAYLQGKTSIRKLAQQFTMSPATIHKFIKQYQETQDLTPQKPGTKKSSKLEEHREFIMKMVESHADWTLQQYSDYLAEHCHVDASLSILCRFFQKEKLTLKKELSQRNSCD